LGFPARATTFFSFFMTIPGGPMLGYPNILSYKKIQPFSFASTGGPIRFL